MINFCETHFLVKEVHTGKQGQLTQLRTQISLCSFSGCHVAVVPGNMWGCLSVAGTKLLNLSHGRCTYFWEHDIAVVMEIDFSPLIFYYSRTVQD